MGGNDAADRAFYGNAMYATRHEALERLVAFVPRAGRAYAESRNEDRGPSDRSNVSTLAPFVRARLITEAETVRAVLTPGASFPSGELVVLLIWAVAAPLAAARWFRWEE